MVVCFILFSMFLVLHGLVGILNVATVHLRMRLHVFYHAPYIAITSAFGIL